MTNQQISRVVRGNDFSMEITVLQPEYSVDHTQWDDFNITSCNNIAVNLICTRDQVVIPLDWHIKEDTTNVIIADVKGKYLHSGTVYALEITGIDAEGRSWRYKNKQVFSIVDATSQAALAPSLMADPLELNATVCLAVKVMPIEIIGPQGPQGEKGEDGVIGRDGVQGPQGVQGAKGRDGIIGRDGAQGAKGDRGAQGPQGVQGARGQDGAVSFDELTPEQIEEIRGPQGKMGPQGESGIQGSKGDEGPQGKQGKAGPQGEMGETGLQGPRGDEGQRGLTGPQGEQGDQGPVGRQGNRGYQGDEGPQGQDGPQGKIGKTGPQGEQGDIGETGPQGRQGKIGPQGEMGETGLEGPQGRIGRQGMMGPQGDLGDTGPQGVQGEIGPQGVQGDRGEIGLTGEQGPQGDLGPQGEIGLTGPQGEIGAQGHVGVQGPQGNIGQQGSIGYEGPQGTQGNRGVQGSQGVQGQIGPQGEGWIFGTAISGSEIYHYVNVTDRDPAIGTLYCNTNSKECYQFIGRTDEDVASHPNTQTWIWYGQIKGQQGAQGNQGRPGTGISSTYVSDTSIDPQTGQTINHCVIVYDDGSENYFDVKDGMQGPQGVQGPANGPQGPQGDLGPQGEIGEQGPQGDLGPQGNQGAKGDVGPQGDKGDAVNVIDVTYTDSVEDPEYTEVTITFDDGYEGIFNIRNGQQGPQGAKGQDGIIGQDGVQGPQGDIGPQGPAGDGANIEQSWSMEADLGVDFRYCPPDFFGGPQNLNAPCIRLYVHDERGKTDVVQEYWSICIEDITYPDNFNKEGFIQYLEDNYNVTLLNGTNWDIRAGYHLILFGHFENNSFIPVDDIIRANYHTVDPCWLSTMQILDIANTKIIYSKTFNINEWFVSTVYKSQIDTVKLDVVEELPATLEQDRIYMIAPPLELKTINNESIVGTGNITVSGGGAQGPQGDAGPQGAKGDTGAQGPQGAAAAGPIPGFQTYSNGMINYKSYNIGSVGSGAIVGGYGIGSMTEIKASGSWSRAYGASTEASGKLSYAAGESSIASGNLSHAEGNSVNAQNKYEFSVGFYNTSTKLNTTLGDAGNTLLSIGNGNGANSSARHNAFEVRQNGDIYYANTEKIDGSTVHYYDAPMRKLQDAMVTSTTNGLKFEIVASLPATQDATTVYLVTSESALYYGSTKIIQGTV